LSIFDDLVIVGDIFCVGELEESDMVDRPPKEANQKEIDGVASYHVFVGVVIVFVIMFALMIAF
jgi:hypothetical protein